MFRIKVCGITTSDDALLAAECGADAIGLNFYEESPRHVEPETAAEILERLRQDYSPQRVQVVAVFVNAMLDDLLWTIRAANLYGPEQGVSLQIHGDEPPQFLVELRQQGLGVIDSPLQATGHVPVVPVVRALRCPNSDLSDAEQYLQNCQSLNALPQAVLLDAHATGNYGGTGQTLDWTGVGKRGNRLLSLPVILAGGLKPDNVAKAIAAARPAAVDVASGVESAPGKKDAAKIWAFVAAAREALEKLDA